MERDCWRHLSKECMSESDNEDGSKTRHSPKWRSDCKCIVYMPIYQDIITNFVLLYSTKLLLPKIG